MEEIQMANNILKNPDHQGNANQNYNEIFYSSQNGYDRKQQQETEHLPWEQNIPDPNSGTEKKSNHKCWQGRRKKNSYTVLVDVYIVIPIMKNNMRIPKKLKVYLLYDSAIPFL